MNLGLPQRRLMACVAILVILVVWVWAGATIGGLLPSITWLQMLYYAIVGIGWAIPVVPVISWSENYKAKGKERE